LNTLIAIYASAGFKYMLRFLSLCLPLALSEPFILNLKCNFLSPGWLEIRVVDFLVSLADGCAASLLLNQFEEELSKY